MSATVAQAGALLAARLLTAPLFVWSGIGKVANFSATAARLPGGESWLGYLLTAGAVGVELGASTLLVLGILVRPVAGIFILYIIAATLMFHQFWASPPAMVAPQTVNFLKNLGLIGAFGMIAAFGAGPYRVRAGVQPRAAAGASNATM
jgi:putative oxidoreductase